MDRKGFVPIVILLIVVGVLVVGGIAYYETQKPPSLMVVYNKIPLASPSTTQNVAVTPSSTPAHANFPHATSSALYGTCDSIDNAGGSSGVFIRPNNAVGVIVTDPDGVTITPDTHIITEREYLTEVPGKWYNSVASTNKDGRPIWVTSSPNLLRGNYNLRVIPDNEEPDKTLRFDLDVMLPNTCIRLASSSTIPDIPKEGYTLNLFDINTAAVVARDTSSTTKRFGFVYAWQSITDGKARVAFEYVYPDSPASRAGLEKGDIVSTINGQSVVAMTADQLDQVIGANDTITIMFTHANSNVLNTITITKEIPK